MRVGLKPAVIVLGVTASVALTGCSGKTLNWKFWESTPAPVAGHAGSEPDSATTATTARPASSSEVSALPRPETPTFGPRPELTDVHFAAGRVTLKRADVKALDGVAGWLMAHPEALVIIEGHTDDLGVREDNLAIGEKRAASIMKHLVSQGVARERITIVSYGPDRPLCTDKTEACRAKNRRVRFLVKQP